MIGDKELIVTDFDYSVYGYRGYDFGYFFSFFDKIVDKKFEFKDESVVRQFITSYVKQCQRIYGSEYSANPINSVDHIMTETKQFMLCYNLHGIKLLVTELYDTPINDHVRFVCFEF